MNIQACYLIRLQFLGFRYSGWQRQPKLKTVESMLRKTLRFVLPNTPFKLLGAGRTDARVSALEAAFELFLEEKLEDTQLFLQSFNANLPPDIRLLRIEEVNKTFNIIHDCIEKEYLYFFACGGKLHPFAAPFMAGIPDSLDIALMARCAALFTGTHDFRAYTVKGSGTKDLVREVFSCTIEENKLLQANFFPKTSYLMRIRSNGFARYQVRMIMGALLCLGRGELTATDIEESLKAGNSKTLTYVAPGSGLVLNRLIFK